MRVEFIGFFRDAASLLVGVVALFLATAGPATAQERIALVVGNGAYTNVGALPNPPNDARLIANTLRSLQFDVIEHIDAETGRLLDAIREHGLAETTYVIYTSDNGPWLPKNHHGGSALPLSGGKGWFQEGGIRVPCVIWGPGRVPAGTRTDALAATIDLFPTIAALAGVQPTTRGPIDGLDLSGVIKGESASPRTELLYCSATRNKNGVHLPGVAGLRQGDWKILGRDLDKNPALYNLADDIGEKKNLAATHPDKLAALRARARELATQLQAETRSLGEYQPPATTDHPETTP